MAITASASLRSSLDAGDRALRSLMTQMEQVVNVHMGEAILDGKKSEALKLEALKVEAIRTNGERAPSRVESFCHKIEVRVLPTLFQDAGSVSQGGKLRSATSPSEAKQPAGQMLVLSQGSLLPLVEAGFSLRRWNENAVGSDKFRIGNLRPKLDTLHP
jgi:hypothetical protein